MRMLLVCVLVACSSSPPAHHGERSTQTPTTTNRPAPLMDAGAGRPPDARAPRDAAIDARSCPARPQPKGCPAKEPNVNHPCKPKGIECTYAAGCCPIVYACDKTGHFEARFSRCD